MKKWFAVVLTVTCVSQQSLGVEGYKDLKFGSSVDEVINSKTCSFAKNPPDKKYPGLETYYCYDFSFGNQNTVALAYFVNGKFLRFSISVPGSQAEALGEALKNKYGAPSSSPTDQEWEKQFTPSAIFWIGFDNDTVFFREIIGDGKGKGNKLYLIYASPLYKKALTENQKKRLENQKKNLESDI